jgi:ABC-type antimicrobial peptide transport system permease subunit
VLRITKVTAAGPSFSFSESDRPGRTPRESCRTGLQTRGESRVNAQPYVPRYPLRRRALLLVALFAALALALAAIGTYGVIAYSVNQRIHEFGVRMALGARPWDVVRSVLANGMKLAIAGTALGIALGLALSRFLGNLLYGVGAADPVAIGATCLVALIVAAVACYVPAVRATRADPMTALRAD